jgi:hypothetical protein
MRWLAVNRFSLYWVSDTGVVKNSITQRPLCPATRNGYLRVKLRRDGRPKMVPVHVAVLEAFVGPRPSPKHHGAHIDGDRRNNRADNLRWALPHENEADKCLHGTHRNGQGRRLSKRTQKRIAARVRRGESFSRVAKVFKLHRHSVARIVRRVDTGKRHMSASGHDDTAQHAA